MKRQNVKFTERLARVYFFFPLQLLLFQFRSNWFLILFWALPFSVVSGNFGNTYGIPTTFYFPEYLGKVGLLSHFMLGFSIGGFIGAYHIASYIANGHNFPFIATLKSPFYKYALNNSFVPLLFLIFHAKGLYFFQTERELLPSLLAILNLLAVLFGAFVFLLIAFSYFFSTNKSYSKYNQKKEAVENLLHKEKDWSKEIQETVSWKIKTYIGRGLRIKLANSGDHYHPELLQKVLQQNHINASLFDVVLILTVVAVGIFGDNDLFFIPAGASVFLVLTLALMIFSAFRSWLQSWASIVLIGLFMLINQLSKDQFFNYLNHAYGLKYSNEKAAYSNETLKNQIHNIRNYEDDIYFQEKTLNNWLAKAQQNEKKPKLILLNCSGGGLRSAAWTFTNLTYLDSITHGEFFKNIHLISGSSGGIMSAAYFRELKRKKLAGENFNSKTSFEALTKDLLNPIIYHFVTRDIFYRPQNLKMFGESYIKDRAFTFENQLHQNLDSAFYYPLSFYQSFEEKAILPTIVFSPTITNDGRRMLISSSHLSFLSNNFSSEFLAYESMPESVEFLRFFEHQNADSLLFSSAIRMSATFPYVLPNVSLPTQPTIEVMDAGVRDNFGLINNLNYIYHLRDWIRQNTSGVLIVQLRDTPKAIKVNQNPVLSMFKSLFNPLGGFTRNWINIQTYNQDQMVQYVAEALQADLSIIDLELKSPDHEEIPISWHLTQKEREAIQNAIHTPLNQQKIDNILTLMDIKSEI